MVGEFKHWMGYMHFLTRRLGNVKSEMTLNVLAYNLKQVMHILGHKQTMKAMLSMGGWALHVLDHAPQAQSGPKDRPSSRGPDD